MKKLLLLITAVMAVASLLAQGDCSKNHPVYKFEGLGSASALRTLGTNPEFPFLRNLATPLQVLNALKGARNESKYARQVKELNDMLKEMGFANGITDVTLSSISSITIPKGTEGNIGNGRYSYAYVRLETGKPARAWKITSDEGCYITVLSACGNAFYPGPEAQRSATFTGNKPCSDMAVNITSEPKAIVLAGEKHITKETYVYYVDHCGCINGCEDEGNLSEDGYRSRPLLLKTEYLAQPAPVTYKVTASGTGTATICNGKPKEVRANMKDITVEKESEFTGEQPEIQREYIEVSRRQYRHVQRYGCLHNDD